MAKYKGNCCKCKQRKIKDIDTQKIRSRLATEDPCGTCGAGQTNFEPGKTAGER